MKILGRWGLFWVGLAGCAGPAVVEDHWPAQLPPRAYYERIWQEDEANQTLQNLPTYLGWVVSFYRGSLLASGWTKTETELLAGLAPADYALVAPKVRCLGELISGEWAKDNRCRRIGSPMLVTWGRAMTEGKNQGRIEPLLDRILADVRGLLRLEVDESQISRARYQGGDARSELVRPK
jgi:hypothetical protein